MSSLDYVFKCDSSMEMNVFYRFIVWTACKTYQKVSVFKSKKPIRVDGASAIQHVSEDFKEGGPQWTLSFSEPWLVIGKQPTHLPQSFIFSFRFCCFLSDHKHAKYLRR